MNTYRTNYRKEQKKSKIRRNQGQASTTYTCRVYDRRNKEVETDGDFKIYTESSSDAVQSPQASTSSAVVQSLNPPTPSRNRSRPTKRTSNSDSVTEDVLLSVRDHFKRPAVPEVVATFL
ncbi:unnamed protein product [Parnassius apollo]|uniref:(apollo) hypothetical protein n=1 Tax=Parnassius apollo TaxID=110799 RepID=A0A8S3WAB9_PARAO|nr:unnamed protein product [Parnassius apollo]